MKNVWKTGLVALSLLCSCADEKANADPLLFGLIAPSESSIRFVNQLNENDDFNIIEYLYFYNGGGVAIGDINNDGLADVYFSGNQVANKLYLNKGNFQFEDITEKAGVAGEGNWKTGITMADVNADGLPDIYLCGVGNYKKFNGFNQLFINNGDLTFSERSTEFGLNFQGFSTQSAFFDYDLDGDLDMYLLNHSVHSQRSYGKAILRLQKDSLAGDRLYQNQLNETGKTFYKNVTEESGIYSSQIGYGLGIGVSDVNRDGYPDIYVSNDFIENDYLYINQKDGAFQEKSQKSFSHTSRFSMGNDIADVNNDAWPDIITLDMMPRDESVIKTSAGEDSYEIYKYKLSFGYGKQVSRNALQINQGNVDDGELVFTDIAPATGVEATDWSWAPLMVDFDGDGWKDLFVANGIVRRPNDLDYINFISSDSVQKTDILPWIQKMPEGKVSNFMFRNKGDLTFEDKTSNWGLSLPSFSNGAAYGDLDNDGDPDLIVNRINETPLVYKNNSPVNRFLKVKLIGDAASGNPFAVGAKIVVTQDSVIQTQELNTTRGWCSSSDYNSIFGLPDSARAVSIQVIWPNGKTQKQEFKGHYITLKYVDSLPHYNEMPSDIIPPLFVKSQSIQYKHIEDDFNAFNRESLVPHTLTTEGPPMAVADVNGDRLEDIFVGGAKGQSANLFIQSKSGLFSLLKIVDFEKDKQAEDVGASFFDADNDGDQDLIVVSGGQEEIRPSDVLLPRLYLNNGRGLFTRSIKSIPPIYLQASCVKPADYDKDGDIDLFIGSSVMPMLYGMSPMSYLLNNDGRGNFSFNPSWLGASQFDNLTRVRPGMIKDALWVDVNKDNRLDLVAVGEWMPITILLQQANHQFLNSTDAYGLSKTRGWWNSILAEDFDDDGDMDFIVGNQGWNSRVRASIDKPLKMYLGDFDSNGGSDHILVYYNGDKSYPLPSRDQLVKQIPSLKKKFQSYRDYRDVLLEDIVTPQQKGNSAEMIVDTFSSVYLQNNEKSFTINSLNLEAQLFPIFAIHSDDFDSDGFKDLMLAGNITATQPELGPYDAGLGLIMKGNGKGAFSPLTSVESGFLVRGEAREIVAVKNAQGKKIYFVSRDNETVLSFKKRD